MLDYVRDAAEIYRQSFATIRAEADLSRFPDDVARHLRGDCPDCGTTVFTAERPFEVAWVEAQ